MRLKKKKDEIEYDYERMDVGQVGEKEKNERDEKSE